jgi:hypothetical protein
MDITPSGEILVVFHRGKRTWTADSFSGPKFEHVTHEEPIPEDTVIDPTKIAHKK